MSERNFTKRNKEFLNFYQLNHGHGQVAFFDKIYIDSKLQGRGVFCQGLNLISKFVTRQSFANSSILIVFKS